MHCNFKRLFGALLFFVLPHSMFAQSSTQVDFNLNRWNTDSQNIKAVEHLGKPSLYLEGCTALLKDVQFTDGIIEVDVAPTSKRIFAGIVFRAPSHDNLEIIYLRLHKSGLPDAIQYCPRYNGIDGWQFYSGKGFTAEATYSRGEWTHFKIVVEGQKAAVYLNHSQTPVLMVDEMKRDYQGGAIGLWGLNGANFANFKFTPLDRGTFQAPAKRPAPDGMLSSWEISKSFIEKDMNPEIYPDSRLQKSFAWEKVSSDATGLVNLSRFRKKTRVMTSAGLQNGVDVVFAKTVIVSDKNQIKKLSFGYSDKVSIFLNGQILYSANATFQSRDPLFQGIVGLNDHIYLPLKKGSNELMVAVSELFGGWGFLCQLAETKDLARSAIQRAPQK
jgi:hypothetical protein